MSKATKALRANGTTVSRHFNNLSEIYQKLIALKDGQEWRTTEFGQQLVEIAKKIKTNIDEIESDTSTQSTVTVRIYCKMRLMQTVF